MVAIRTVTAGAAQQGLSFAEFVRRGMDPTSIAVMMEDGAACAGLVVAGNIHDHNQCNDNIMTVTVMNVATMIVTSVTVKLVLNL